MESLPDQRVLKFHPNTLTYIRSQYNLDKPGEMDRAIDVLEEWLDKQNQLRLKRVPPLHHRDRQNNHSRSFLERQIILDKGSVERTKNQIEKLFTMKTIVPSFLGKYDVKNDFKGFQDFFIQTLMPKLTQEHYRIYAAKLLHDNFDSKAYSQYFYIVTNILEYIRAFDYCNGLIAVYDYRSIDILHLVAQINLTELKQLIGYLMQGYQMRLRGLHFITTSKTVDMLVKILKQMFSEKIGKRIHVHKSLESLHEHVPKDCLPKEFGGDQKSLQTLCDEFTDELGRKENVDYFREMGKAAVNESLRVGDKTSKDDILGISGSFRTISVD